MLKINTVFLFLILGFIMPPLQAQLITTDPTFPNDNEAVTITFFANEGNGGLAGYTGDVYAHTGVITNNSGSNSDWKYVISDWGGENIPKAKLTRIATDTYTLSITPNIRSFYGVPARKLSRKWPLFSALLRQLMAATSKEKLLITAIFSMMFMLMAFL